MDRSRKIDLLNRVLHNTVNGVLQYIENAAPYVPEPLAERYREVLAARDEEARTATAIAERVTELDGVPRVGVFPYWNVDLNYLDLRFLCRFAARHQRAAIEELESELPLIADDPALHRFLEGILDEKRRHLELLESVGTAELPSPSEERIAAAQPLDPQHVPRPDPQP